jgi:hypothetical protein
LCNLEILSITQDLLRHDQVTGYSKFLPRYFLLLLIYFQVLFLRMLYNVSLNPRSVSAVKTSLWKKNTVLKKIMEAKGKNRKEKEIYGVYRGVDLTGKKWVYQLIIARGKEPE